MKPLKILKIENKKYIVLDNEAFDWELDPEQIKTIENKVKSDPGITESVIGNIFSHLTSSFSEFVGKEVSLKEINDALEKGCI